MSDHDEKKRRRALSISEAAEQNFDYFGLLSGERLDLEDGGEIIEIPHPEYLLPDQQQRISELRVRFDSYKRTGNGEFIDAKGKPIEPPYDVQLCVALWGETDYERFIKAGGRPGLVNMVWARMNAQFANFKRDDSKSGAGN